MEFQTVKDIDVKDKTVLLRADLNVPVVDGKVLNTARLDRTKPTIDWLVSHGAKTLIMAHRSEKKGMRKEDLSFQFLPPVLEERWGVPVIFIEDCLSEQAKQQIEKLQPGEIGVFENIRFYPEEKANEPGFAKKIAALGDIYVNDAFSVAHRAHTSTEGLAHLLPSAAGFLMAAELEALDKALVHPAEPVCAITGGSKISTKISVLRNLIDKVDYLVLGGGMANTFLYAQGAETGGSLCEKDMAELARDIMAYAREKSCTIVLPSDCVCVHEIKPDAEHNTIDCNSIPQDMRAIDIGPTSIRSITEILQTCKTVLWNGPLGIFEVKPFDQGTNELARAVAELTRSGKITSIAGGGDTIAALENAGVANDFSYVSTAGGAFLEWLEGKTLPGVAALMRSKAAA